MYEVLNVHHSLSNYLKHSFPFEKSTQTKTLISWKEVTYLFGNDLKLDLTHPIPLNPILKLKMSRVS